MKASDMYDPFEAFRQVGEQIDEIIGNSHIVIETICRLWNLHNQAADLGRKRVLEKVSPESFQLDDAGVDKFREAIRVGGKEAIGKMVLSDPATLLSLCRRFGTTDLRAYKKVLDERTLKRHGEDLPVVAEMYANICRGLVPLLEERVKVLALKKEIESYGISSNGEGLGITTPTFGMDVPPKQFLGGWGSAFCRMIAVADLLQQEAVARGVAQQKLSIAKVTEDVFSQLTSRVVALSPGRPGNPTLTVEEEAKIAVGIAHDWVSCGMPLLQPTHKLAASLMATTVPKEHVPDVVVPWPTFFVEIPDGLLPALGATLAYVGLVPYGGKPTVCVFTKHHARATLFGLDSLADLSDYMPFKSTERDEEAERVMKLLGRLLLGCMIELDSDEHKKRVSRGPNASATDSLHRGGKIPSSWVFQIKRDVKVDVRAFVRDYVEKGGKSLSVQCLVRGHRKRQPYGPKGSLRKWIHVEPYWKGPEDAPVALRSHKLD